ncbi:MAG: CHASE3 domain-containing protein [Candidatus Sulfotelmatobacter sp.]
MSKNRLDPRMVRQFGVFGGAASFFSMMVGSSSLLGWWFDVSILKSWLPGQPSIRVNAAICFVLLGIALWLLRKKEEVSFAKEVAARIASAITALVGLIVLAENLLGWNAGIDQLLHVVRSGEELGSVRPGLIPTIAALNFLLLGCGFLILNWRTRHGYWPAQWLAVVAAINSTFGIFDFVLVRQISHTHIALPAAINFAVLSLGLICVRSEWALGGVLASTGAGAKLLRRAVPSALAVLAFIGWLLRKPLLTEAHLSWIEVSTLGMVSSLLLVLLVVWNARILDRVERDQQLAEAVLHVNEDILNGILGRFEDSPVETLLRRWVLSGIGLAVLLTALMGVLSWRSARDASEDADWVAHTYAVKSTLAVALGHAVDMETGTRGFAATGDDSFLEPYDQGKLALPNDLDTLRRLTADNPVQQQRQQLLASQIEARIETSNQIFASRRQRRSVPAESLFLEGKHQMDAVRTTIAEMQAEESRLLDKRVARAQEAQRLTHTISLAGTLVGAALLMFCGFAIGRQISHGARLRGQLTALNTSLEQRVEQRTAALRESEENYRTLFESMDEGFCTIEVLFDQDNKPVDYRFLTVNPVFEKQTGIPNAAGRKMREIAPQHEEHWFQIYGKIALTGEPARFENEAAQLNRWYEVHACRVGKPHEKKVAIVFNDITVRKHAALEIQRLNDELEHRVNERTTQLMAANKEMEAFTYSVSHDLRAPLRHISGFANILSEEYGPSLAPDARHHLQRIQEGTRRMGQLVDDLLNLARMGRRDLSLRVSDLKPVIEDAIAELAGEYTGRQVEWKVGDLPVVECDPGLIRQVFQNLLTNALKFTRPRPQAVIEVGKIEKDGALAIFVRDNGVGFDMKYADKLFGVFQRLHRAEDFEGTGVGLATVQRIIQKHGGSVWAEGELDKGATFYFTLQGSGKTGLKTRAAIAGDPT